MCKRFLTILLLSAQLLMPALTANAELFEKPDVKLSAEHALVINLNTGTEAFALAADEKLFPASTTKIMTAILTLEECSDLEEKVEVTKEAMSCVDFYSSKAGLLAGESLTVRELLGLLMVKSACDAACVLAERVSGSEEAFVALMNKKAAELGCVGTHFVNSTGMHNENHYSTARDMAVITRYALRDERFVEFFRQKQVSVGPTELSKKRFFSTTNFLIDRNRGGRYYYKYATGGKTGTTTPAGRCLISTAEKDGAEYLCLVFGAAGDNSKNINKAFTDTAELYKWCFSNLSLTKISSSETAQFETKLRYAWNHDYATLTVAKDVYALLPDAAEIVPEPQRDDGTGNMKGLLVKVELPEKLDAPVQKGDPAGVATYFYRDDGKTVLARADIVVYESVDRNFFAFIFSKIGGFFSSTAMIVILIILAVALVAFIVLRLVKRSRERRSYSMPRTRKYKKHGRYRRF